MRPFSAHIAFMGHELAVAFGKAEEPAPDEEPERVQIVELMPVMSETERAFGFGRNFAWDDVQA